MSWSMSWIISRPSLMVVALVVACLVALEICHHYRFRQLPGLLSITVLSWVLILGLAFLVREFILWL